MLFVVSKVPELLDTAFLVLRRRRVIFLHTYHHVTVLLFCWDAYATRSSAGLIFACVNYFVHAVMYGYFALVAAGFKSVHRVAGFVTGLQIAQMAVGCGVLAYAAHEKISGRGCDMTTSNLLFGAAIYSSYLVLFVLFALDRYVVCGTRGVGKSGKSGKSGKKEKEEEDGDGVAVSDAAKDAVVGVVGAAAGGGGPGLRLRP
jgi:hypothetical protein